MQTSSSITSMLYSTLAAYVLQGLVLAALYLSKSNSMSMMKEKLRKSSKKVIQNS